MRLGIVCPCYNEHEVLLASAGRLTALLDGLVAKGKVAADSFVMLVNDGSRDNTWELIVQLFRENPYFRGINLGKNVGHQSAIMAGMMTVKAYCDAVITIDVDLQDDLNAIEEMVDRYREGYDIVYGVKVSREGDSFLKKNTALAFYKLQKMMGVNAVYNHADFRLMSRRALKALMSYPERNIFLRGMVPRIGLSTACVYYDRKERMAGKSKYPFSKMFALAMDGITSFSVRPLQWIYIAGFIMVFLALVAITYCLSVYQFSEVVWGWTSILISIWFIGGATLVSIGIIGEYVGKIYREVKRRPRYFVEKIVDGEEEQQMGRDF